MDMSEERKVTINLICPSVSVSKLVQYVGSEDVRIDFGSISTIFGLDPLTIKINGHFISIGVDYIATSVTWKSLLSFFSARGRSTGISACEPLKLDGKLCKVGTKNYIAVEHRCTKFEGIGLKRRHNLDVDSPRKKSQMYESSVESYISSKYAVEENKISKCDESGLKRKNWVDAVQPRKKTRTHE